MTLSLKCISWSFTQRYYKTIQLKKIVSQADFAEDMNYPQQMLNSPERDVIKSEIQQDFAKADIYFQSLNVQTIKQEEKYTVTQINFTYFIHCSIWNSD